MHPSHLLDLETGLAAFWTAQPAFKPVLPLLVAVSGGVDSLSLLHWLVHRKGLPAGGVHIAHIDHGLRPDSAADAAFVAATATAWGAPLHLLQADVRGHQATRRVSLEAAAREVRYARLAETAVQIGATQVLVGHQANDQAETLLLNLLRGTGLAGLQGMRPVTPWPWPGYPQLVLVRPLLAVSRAAVEAYARQQGLRPREDPTNLNPAHTRNRVRHELLPLLTRFNPEILSGLGRTAALLAEDAALLQTLHDEAWENVIEAAGDGWVRGRLAPWRDLPLSARRAVVRTALERASAGAVRGDYAAVGRIHAALLEGQTGTRIDAGGGWQTAVYYDTFVVSRGHPAAALDQPQLATAAAQPLPAAGTVPLAGGWRLRVVPGGGESGPWQVTLPVTQEDPLILRGRRPGERFAPAGLDGTVTLKEWMINSKIPAPLRARWPLVADSRGVLWVAGHRLAGRAEAIPPGSGRVTIIVDKES